MANLTPHKAWDVIDSSKLTTYLDCPRKFFFEHILGWRPARPAHDLIFGEAWHRAREHQLLHGYSDVAGAYAKFIAYYREHFEPDTDDMYQPKDPVGAMLALNKFAHERADDTVVNKVLLTETSGTVPIDDKGHKLYYRMDSVMQTQDGRYFSWDHKSAKRFSRVWADKFHLSIQNGTYTHCLYCMFPVDEVLGVEFCGTCFEYLKRGSAARPQGHHISFMRVPAYKTPGQMNTWLFTVVTLVEEIERDMDRLSHCSEHDEVLQAFRMNPESCTKYYGCAFHDYCQSWQNPLWRCEEPPLGFQVEFWDPTEMKTTNKKDLEWKQ